MKKSFSFSPFVLLIVPVIFFLLLSVSIKNEAPKEEFVNATSSSAPAIKVSSGLLKLVLK